MNQDEVASAEVLLERADLARLVYGQRDAHLRAIEGAFEVRIGARGERLVVSGSKPDVRAVESLLTELYRSAAAGRPIEGEDLRRAVEMFLRQDGADLAAIFTDNITVSASKSLTPKTAAQKDYVDAIRGHDLVFGIGPAGTGKTFLAVAMALAHLHKKKVRRIILTRPAVEAGERLGFLPGDLSEKVNPYLRPLLDALTDLLDAERVQRMLERQIVEIAPLAFMRGRTLNDAFIILDEAQNTTREQMKMFLTRLGVQSKAVVTGDATQIDLPRPEDSGLVHARRVLEGVEGVAEQTFSDVDVVRHGLVQRIIRAYEAHGRA